MAPISALTWPVARAIISSVSAAKYSSIGTRDVLNNGWTYNGWTWQPYVWITDSNFWCCMGVVIWTVILSLAYSKFGRYWTYPIMAFEWFTLVIHEMIIAICARFCFGTKHRIVLVKLDNSEWKKGHFAGSLGVHPLDVHKDETSGERLDIKIPPKVRELRIIHSIGPFFTYLIAGVFFWAGFGLSGSKIAWLAMVALIFLFFIRHAHAPSVKKRYSKDRNHRDLDIARDSSILIHILLWFTMFFTPYQVGLRFYILFLGWFMAYYMFQNMVTANDKRAIYFTPAHDFEAFHQYVKLAEVKTEQMSLRALTQKKSGRLLLLWVFLSMSIMAGAWVLAICYWSPFFQGQIAAGPSTLHWYYGDWDSAEPGRGWWWGAVPQGWPCKGWPYNTCPS